VWTHTSDIPVQPNSGEAYSMILHL
jgi:hypothetical protein